MYVNLNGAWYYRSTFRAVGITSARKNLTRRSGRGPRRATEAASGKSATMSVAHSPLSEDDGLPKPVGTSREAPFCFLRGPRWPSLLLRVKKLLAEWKTVWARRRMMHGPRKTQYLHDHAGRNVVCAGRREGGDQATRLFLRVALGWPRNNCFRRGARLYPVIARAACHRAWPGGPAIHAGFEVNRAQRGWWVCAHHDAVTSARGPGRFD
jgi:hypothetical protein